MWGKWASCCQGKGRVRHRKGQLLVAMVAMLCVLLGSRRRRVVGPYCCRLKLRAGLEVGHVLGMAEAMDGHYAPVSWGTASSLGGFARERLGEFVKKEENGLESLCVKRK